MRAKFRNGRWRKPLGAFLICFAYILLAGGIALACLPINIELRIVMPIVGVAAFGLCGVFGTELLDVYVSGNSKQARREWRELSHPKRFLFVLTFPCRLIVRVIDFFNI